MASRLGSTTHTSSAGSRPRSDESHCPSLAPTSTTQESGRRSQSGKSENRERSIASLTRGEHAENQEEIGEAPGLAARSRFARIISTTNVGATLLTMLRKLIQSRVSHANSEAPAYLNRSRAQSVASPHPWIVRSFAIVALTAIESAAPSGRCWLKKISLCPVANCGYNPPTLVDQGVEVLGYYALGWDSTTSTWHLTDLTLATGAVLALPGSPLNSHFNTISNVDELYYVGTDQHIHEFFG